MIEEGSALGEDDNEERNIKEKREGEAVCKKEGKEWHLLGMEVIFSDDIYKIFKNTTRKCYKARIEDKYAPINDYRAAVE